MSDWQAALSEAGFSESDEGRRIEWRVGGMRLPMHARVDAETRRTLPLLSSELLGLELSLRGGQLQLRAVGSLGDLLGDPLAEDRVVPAGDGEDAHLRIDLGVLDAERKLRVAPGYADLTVGATNVRLVVRLYAGERWARAELWAEPNAPDAKVVLGLDLVALDEAGEWLQRLPIQAVATKRFANLDVALSEPTRLLHIPLDGDLLPSITPDRALRPVVHIDARAIRELDVPLFGDLGVRLANTKLGGAEALEAAWTPEGLRITGLTLTFDLGGRPVKLVKGRLEVDGRLRLGPALALDFELETSVAIDAPSVMTLVLHRGHRYRLGPDGESLRLDVTPRAGAPAASAFVPPLAKRTDVEAAWDYAGPEIASHFVLDVWPNEQGRSISIGPTGVELRAVARRRSLQIPNLRDVVTTDGEISVRGSQWSLRIGASAKLPWFENAGGAVELRAGSGVEGGLAFDASFEMSLADAWSDPSGILTLRDPSVWVRLGWTDGWQVEGGLTGTLVFGQADLLGGASAWVSEIFSGLSVEFEGLELSSLDGLDLDKVQPKLSLRRPFSCRLWDVFEFDLEGLTLSKRGVGFAGRVGFELGPVGLAGALPDLRLELEDGRVRLASGGQRFEIEAALELPSGVRGRMRVRQAERQGVSMLEGEGTLSVPSLPEAQVFIAIGRFRRGDAWRPTIAVFGQVDTVLTVLPGLVVRKVGLGLGVHRTLAGLPDLYGMSALEMLDHLTKAGAVSPERGAGWVLAEDTPVTLVARSMASGTTGPKDEIDFWVGDMVVALDSHLRLAAAANAWAFTSLDDAAQNAELRSHPFARAALALDPGVPSLVAAGRTLPDGRSSLGLRSAGLASAVTALVTRSQTQMHLEVRPHLFDLQIGPRTYNESLGPLGHVHASSTMRVHMERGGTMFASLQTRWAARIHGSFSGRLGPVEFGVWADAGFDVGFQVAGGLHRSNLFLYGRAHGRAWFEVGAWARVSIRIEFKVKFKIGPFKVKVKVKVRFETKKYEVRTGIEADVTVEAALGSGGVGAIAHASIGVGIAGITARGSITVPYRKGYLEQTRSTVAGLLGK